jgi:two-component system, NtrC family, sensor histidine kinase GlrK
MFKIPRPSFGQFLLLAFLLIAGLLAAAAVGGLFALERLMAQSRDAGERSVQLAAAAQRLAEQSVAMERAGRQYMVLEDPMLLRRFQGFADDATNVLNDPLAPQLSEEIVKQWRSQLKAIRQQLALATKLPQVEDDAVNANNALRLQDTLMAQFRQLDETNAAIAEEIRLGSKERNRALQDALESGRAKLARQVLGTIALAVALALGFALWLTRPLRKLELAIAGLGENRLDQVVDIQGPSDIRALGTRLDWLRLRLLELDDDKARFLRHISHELKTPLASLREGIALLEEGVAGRLSPDQAEITKILSQNALTLQAQIEDLLRFNAAAFDARSLSRRKTELKALIANLIEAQRLQWQAKELRVICDGEPLVVEADAEKLSIAIGNLLLNAIRFSPVRATVRIALSQSADRAYIDIQDQGAGVAEADRERIFEPFFRGERQPEGVMRGSGIGLSIVREYVEAHGGRVDLIVDNAPEAQQNPEKNHQKKSQQLSLNTASAIAIESENAGAHFRIELPNVVS